MWGTLHTSEKNAGFDLRSNPCILPVLVCVEHRLRAQGKPVVLSVEPGKCMRFGEHRSGFSVQRLEHSGRYESGNQPLAPPYPATSLEQPARKGIHR